MAKKQNEPVTRDQSEQANEPADRNGTSQIDQQWQKELLPLMKWMVAGLAIFFFAATLVQLFVVYVSIRDAPTLATDNLYPLSNSESQTKIPSDAFQHALVHLEANALQQRYHQANVLLISRVWTKYLGYITGMILCLVGASFVLGKIIDSPTRLESPGDALRFTLSTTSPGIVLATLGTLLIITSIYSHNRIDVDDGPAYLHAHNGTKQQSSSSFQKNADAIRDAQVVSNGDRADGDDKCETDNGDDSEGNNKTSHEDSFVEDLFRGPKGKEKQE